jgi:hypothetical protein
MKWFVALLLSAALASPVSAESCNDSREYLLDGLAGDLPAPASSYQEIFRACMAALDMANVKDAYVLKDGGVAIVPRSNTLAATTETLAQFCRRFPNDVAKILTLREQRYARSVSSAVLLPSLGTTTCREIGGDL